MSGPYIHEIDPVIGTAWGVHFWWYGLTYTLGFLTLYTVLHPGGGELGLSRREAYSLVLLVSLGTLLGGRFVEVAFYEWPFYRDHPHLIPVYWLGGMSTHGLVLGAIAGILLFCRIHGKPFLAVADAVAVPGALYWRSAGSETSSTARSWDSKHPSGGRSNSPMPTAIAIPRCSTTGSRTCCSSRCSHSSSGSAHRRARSPGSFCSSTPS